MLLRMSGRFQRHFSCSFDAGTPPVLPFPQTWNIDLFRHGRELVVLASEEFSLFTLLIPIKGTRSLETFFAPFRERLERLFENIRLWEKPDLTAFTLSRRTDRKVIGSQCDFLRLADAYLSEQGPPLSAECLLRVEENLNIAPRPLIGMESPIDVLMRETEKLKYGRQSGRTTHRKSR